MNFNDVEDQVLASSEQTAITALVTVMGHASTFTRIKADIERVGESMKGASGAQKRKQVFANLEVFGKDLVEDVALPVIDQIGENIVRILMELAVNYIKLEAEGK